VVLVAGAFAAYPSLPEPASFALATVLAVAAVVAAATRRGSVAAVATLCGATEAACLVPPLRGLYPLPLALALAASAAVTLALEGRSGFRWLRAGTWNRSVAAWTLLVVLLSAAGLLVGARLAHGVVPRLALPQLPPLGLGAGVLGWSAVNAAAEELAFRGALLHALEVSLEARLAILVQAAAFGAMHLPVAPGGWTGCALVAGFAVMAALLRRRSGGLLAPWIAHAAADVVMLAIRLGA